MLKKSVLSVITAAGLLLGVSSAPANAEHHNAQKNWVASWGTSQQMSRESGVSHDGFKNQTIRMIVNPNQGGKDVRLRFSNLYGVKPLVLDKVVLAHSATGAETVPKTGRMVTFKGKKRTVIPVGREISSDSVDFEVKENQDLTVSVYTHSATGPTTWHPLSKRTTYVSEQGDHTSENQSTSFTKGFKNWFWMEGIDVAAKDKKTRVIITLGDSITDSYGFTSNPNRSWGDYFDQRLKEKYKHRSISVINSGISGNRILRDSPIFGEKALDRLNHDVLEQPGVTDMILLEGINDIGQEPHEFDSSKIIAGMQQIIDKAHAKGIKVYGGTLTPFRGTTIANYFTEEGEKTREEVNQWIRTSGAFDEVIDFERMIQDPADPQRLLPAFDSGDHLHPSDAGFQAMAYGVNLSLFK
ncbi:SGNH/GDSL hydrolase family protein [Fictibacillus sp. WQ 8-8]|uniref:SGNH/GDSL hydrolase family protein n=1 Tax=Fictibacillus sp. WQ 8-8 TaxID=2938788 RepID=UPI00210DD8B5|nr:SGNH/GDSL hydrolase family protein [Fictibacillus sp. WQ 8-8]MCQ6267847.1 SGNH/GDSL hydrolase family protein [Fictibacillus sp. WQ 8-8]